MQTQTNTQFTTQSKGNDPVELGIAACLVGDILLNLAPNLSTRQSGRRNHLQWFYV